MSKTNKQGKRITPPAGEVGTIFLMASIHRSNKTHPWPVSRWILFIYLFFTVGLYTHTYTSRHTHKTDATERLKNDRFFDY